MILISGTSSYGRWLRQPSFGTMAFALIYQKPAEAPRALAATALGGVVGLVATSPESHS
jgi:hypothetical protein